MLSIPHAPEELVLLITNEWNGSSCADESLRATASFSQTKEGLRVHLGAVLRGDEKIPSARPGRFDGLWEYDVVEAFFVGVDGHYLELELGAGSHWLLLSFDSIRHRSNSHETPDFLMSRYSVTGKTWGSEVVIPWTLMPMPLIALNAFQIARGHFHAAYKLPGAQADFHQPGEFPKVQLAVGT